MQKKFMIAAIVVCTGLVLVAYSFTMAPNTRHTATDKVQVTETSAMPEHCNPSDCTPEKQAECPYSKQAQSEAAAAGNCPATKECPPSKCQSSDSKATI